MTDIKKYLGKGLSEAKINRLDELICNTTSKDKKRCIAIDLIRDTANIITMSELNYQLITTRIDILEEKVQLFETEMVKYVDSLYNGDFTGWSEDSIKGYKTAMISIKEKILKRKHG